MQRSISVRIAAGLIYLLGKSQRITLSDPNNILGDQTRDNVIFAFWHNRILLLPYMHKMFSSRKLCVMISKSRDGQWITDVAARFGVKATRGSSSRGGAAAFRGLLENLLQPGTDVGVTPDGPRGPCYKAHVGVVWLSYLSSCPIVPVKLSLAPKICLPSWDRFQIPYPFAKCFMEVEPAMSLPEGTSDAHIEHHCKMLEDLLLDGKK